MSGPDEAQIEPPWGWDPAKPQLPPNEHARLLSLSLDLAGLPASLNATPASPFRVTAFVRKGPVPYGARQSAMPAPFAQGFVLAPQNLTLARKYTIPGFASLPDHSYSMADWAGGNETCPPGTSVKILDYGKPKLCHVFADHLGLVNSTHFVPQAGNMYRYYHRLALKRAGECGELGSKFNDATIAPESTDLANEAVKECERESLLIEAVGQHFLQDAWAIGHMWQRWGYPDFFLYGGDVNSNDQKQAAAVYRALAAGLTAGTIHGAESILHVPDEMSAGGRQTVTWVNPLIPGIHPGIGDFHLATLLSDATYETQKSSLLSCGAAGLREVYERTAKYSSEPKGTIGVYKARSRPNPISAWCLAQRATNSALAEGFGVSCPSNYGLPCEIKNAVVIAQLLGGLLIQKSPDLLVSSALTNEFSDSLMLAGLWSIRRSKLDPNGIDLAESGLLPPSHPTFVGVQVNSVAASEDPPSGSADPNLPWPTNAIITEQNADDPSLRLGRLFNRAHLKDWCENPESDPYRLKYQVSASTSTEQRAATCEACVEFVRRRVGDNKYASLCLAAGASPVNLTLDSRVGAPRSTAIVFCGCEKKWSLPNDFVENPDNVWSYQYFFPTTSLIWSYPLPYMYSLGTPSASSGNVYVLGTAKTGALLYNAGSQLWGPIEPNWLIAQAPVGDGSNWLSNEHAVVIRFTAPEAGTYGFSAEMIQHLNRYLPPLTLLHSSATKFPGYESNFKTWGATNLGTQIVAGGSDYFNAGDTLDMFIGVGANDTSLGRVEFIVHQIIP